MFVVIGLHRCFVVEILMTGRRQHAKMAEENQCQE